MTTTNRDFTTRLAAARQLLAWGDGPPVPVRLDDQFKAASVDAGRLQERIGTVMPLVEPGRNWRQRQEPRPSTDMRAYLIAGLSSWTALCPHLRREGSQPTIVSLPLRRIDCERCVQTVRCPPADEADRCDLCGQRGVNMFHPFSVRWGPLLVMGDVCPARAATPGIRAETAQPDGDDGGVPHRAR